MSATPPVRSCSNKQVTMKISPKLNDAIDVKHISMLDLSTMKMHDSFMYYSIPEVRRAKMLEEDVETAQVDAQPRSVVRKSRISFECHPDLLLEEVGDSDSDDDCDDPLDVLLANLHCF